MVTVTKIKNMDVFLSKMREAGMWLGDEVEVKEFYDPDKDEGFILDE